MKKSNIKIKGDNNNVAVYDYSYENIQNNFITNITTTVNTNSAEEQPSLIEPSTMAIFALFAIAVISVMLPHAFKIFNDYELHLFLIISLFLLTNIIYISIKSEQQHRVKNIGIATIQAFSVLVSLFINNNINIPSDFQTFLDLFQGELTSISTYIDAFQIYMNSQNQFRYFIFGILFILTKVVLILCPFFINIQTFRTKKIPNIFALIAIIFATIFYLFGHLIIK